MINFTCLKCAKEQTVQEFKNTDVPNIVKVPCICGYIMQVTKPCGDLDVYEIGTFYPPPVVAPTYDYDC